MQIAVVKVNTFVFSDKSLLTLIYALLALRFYLLIVFGMRVTNVVELIRLVKSEKGNSEYCKV